MISSKEYIANIFGCTVKEVKERFKQSLREKGHDAKEAKALIESFRNTKYKESRRLSIPLEDTPAAYMEQWTKEYFENREFADKKRTEEEVIDDFLEEYPGIKGKVLFKDEPSMVVALENHPDLLELFLTEIETAGQPAERYRRSAIDEMVYNTNYKKAISLINEGLRFNCPRTHHLLLILRAECYNNISEYEKAINDAAHASSIIDDIYDDSSDKYYLLYDLNKISLTAYQGLDDLTKSNSYKMFIEIHRAKAFMLDFKEELGGYDVNEILKTMLRERVNSNFSLFYNKVVLLFGYPKYHNETFFTNFSFVKNTTVNNDLNTIIENGIPVVFVFLNSGHSGWICRYKNIIDDNKNNSINIKKTELTVDYEMINTFRYFSNLNEFKEVIYSIT